MANWFEYNEGQRQRGDLTVKISEAALGLWSAPRRTTRGGQPHYPDLAVELCMTLGMAFKQPLRQTQGLMRSIAGLLGVEIAVPDFSTLSRRSSGLTLRATRKLGGGIGHSTGGGEVTAYVAKAEPGRVSKAVLLGAIPPLMLKTEANLDGVPIEVLTGCGLDWPPTARNSSSTFRQVLSMAPTVTVPQLAKARSTTGGVRA